MSDRVVVMGGSVAGLGAALALSGIGRRVTVIEADATPLPESPGEAFEKWDRRGSPQARQSHALLGRLRNLIRDRAPDLLEKLLAAGASELRFSDRLHQLFPDAEDRPGDEDIVFLACRRIVFEYVLRRHVLDTGRVEFRDGVEATGLLHEVDAASGLPRVTGVRLRTSDGAEDLHADVLIDASGRRSKLRHWLPELGTAEVREERSPCGIFYTTRFYRLLDGASPPALDGGVTGIDLGYLKAGIFAGDSRVFSITLAASPEDGPMRSVLRVPGFERACERIPRTAEWVDPAVSEPISDVEGMAKLENVRRFFSEGGRPLALGVFPIGDALIHTNPLTGRGCSLGWVGAFGVAEILERHAEGRDWLACAQEFEEMVEREIAPWYALQCSQDADSIRVSRDQREGRDPYQVVREDGTNDSRAFMRGVFKEGLRPAVGENPEVFRIFMRALNLLEPPANLMNDPVVLKAVMDAYARRDQREAVYDGPDRPTMLKLLAPA